MDLQRNPVGWFEIPVTDMERAVKFYETVFGFTMIVPPGDFGPIEMRWFPMTKDMDGPGAMGALVRHEQYFPSASQGVLIYFTARSGDCAKELAKAKAAGGKVLREKTLIKEDIGYMGLFLDSEGNRIAVHSRT